MTRMENVEALLRRRTDPQPPARKRRLGLLARYYRFRLFVIERKHKVCTCGSVRKGVEL